MGNKPCTVGIRTDQETYDAGSVVTGTIYVSITTSKPVQATSLNLSFVGEERVVIHHTTSESHTDHQGRTTNRHRDHYERANCIFYKFDYPIASFQGKQGGIIAPGQYEYPFQVTLPQDLPGCTSCVRGQSRCDILYKMTAHFVQPDAGFFSKPPHFTKSFGVLAHTDAQQTNDVAGIKLPPEVTPVKTCCCFGKGTMTLQCEIDKSILSPHDHLEIQFAGKNESTVKVLNVKVELDEIVEWHAHGHSEKLTRAAAERVLAGGHEMPEFQELRRVPRRHHYFGIPDSSDATASLTNNTPSRKTFLVVPGDIRDTYRGNLMEVRHIVTITLVTSGGCCTTSPESCVALQVRRRPTGGQAVAVPANGPIYNDSTTTVTPTAPTEDIQSFSSSTTPVEAPPAYAPATSAASFNNNNNNNNDNTNGYPAPTAPLQEYGDYDDDHGNDVVMAQAEPVLPVDWSAQTANVVEIPMAQAMLLDFDHPSPSAPLPPSGSYT